jgi:hypothetical protein
MLTVEEMRAAKAEHQRLTIKDMRAAKAENQFHRALAVTVTTAIAAGVAHNEIASALRSVACDMEAEPWPDTKSGYEIRVRYEGEAGAWLMTTSPATRAAA